MTDPNDAIDPNEDFDTDLGFDVGEPDKGSRNNALMKIGLIAGGIVIVLIVIFSMGGSSGPQTRSTVAAPATETGKAANTNPTPEYREAVEERNKQRIEDAQQTGKSVMPLSVDPAQEQLRTSIPKPEEDPAERLRRIQAEYDRAREQEQLKANAQQAQANAQARAQALQAMSQAMSSYLSSASGLRQPAHISEIGVSFTTAQQGGGSGNGSGTGTGGMGTTGADGSTQNVPKTLLAAATIEYGQLLIEANTDVQGPVLALMASGKLSGSRLLGSFQKTDQYITLNFNQLVTKDGRAIPVQAIALDPDTTLPGMVTEIDHRYFERYILPAAAQFVSGVGSALAETQQQTTQTASSTVTTSKSPDFSEAIAQGIGDSFDGLSQIIQDEGRRTRPMLRIAAGTPIGILFTDAVVDQTNAERAADANIQAVLNSQKQGLGQLYMPGYTQNPATTGYQLPQVMPQMMNGAVPMYQNGVGSAPMGAALGTIPPQ